MLRLGTVRSLPRWSPPASTTIELKSQFPGLGREGVIRCTARPLHQGRTTQVLDAVVLRTGSTKPIARFAARNFLWPRRKRLSEDGVRPHVWAGWAANAVEFPGFDPLQARSLRVRLL